MHLYADALAKPCVTFEDRCKSGRNIKPAYLPGTVGLKDVRTSARQSVKIRVKSRVSLCAGAVDGASDQNFSRGETRRERRSREYFARKGN